MEKPTLRSIANAAFIAVVFGLTVTLLMFVLEIIVTSFELMRDRNDEMREEVHELDKRLQELESDER